MKNPYYLCLFPFALILLCLTHSNGMKSIHLKVLGSIFEENLDKIYSNLYYLSKDHRFRILLFHPGTVHQIVQYVYTDKFDVRTVLIDDNVHSMDVKITVLGASERIFHNLQIQSGKMFTLPFHDTIPMPVLSSAYDESIFSKPIRHLHFVVSFDKNLHITPISIECMEKEMNKKKKELLIWGHKFNNKRELKIQEAVCQHDEYKFTYEDIHNNKLEKELTCGEPIFELGFVNQYDIMHDRNGNEVSCGLKKNNGIQLTDQTEFSTSKKANSDQKPYLAEFITKISQIRDIYLMQKNNNLITPETALQIVKAKVIGHAKQQHELLAQFSSEVEKVNIDPIQRQYKKLKTKTKNKSHQVRQEDIHVGRNAQDLHSVGNYAIDFQQAVQSHHLGSSGVQNVHPRIHGQTHDPMANYESDFQQNVQSHHVGSPGIQNVQPQAGIYGQIDDHGQASGSGFHQHNLQTHQRGGDEMLAPYEQLDLLLQQGRAPGEGGHGQQAVDDGEDLMTWLMRGDESSARGLDVSDYLHGQIDPDPSHEQMSFSPHQLDARPISSANEWNMLSESSPIPFDLHEFDNPSAWTMPSNVDEYDTESVIHQQHHSDKGKAKMGESSDLTGIKRKISAKMEEVREEIAQMEKLKNYTEDCLNKARESWEEACKMLENKKVKLEELEKENKRQKRQK